MTPHPPEPAVPTTSPTRGEVEEQRPSSTSPLEGEVGSGAERPGRVGGRFVSPRRVIGTLVLIAAVACLYFVPSADTAWAFAKSRLDTWKAWVDAHFPLAAVLFVLVYVCVVTPPLPLAAVTALIGGALFGRWWGTGLMSVASVISATLAFLLARYLFRDWANRRLGGLMRRINAGFARDGVWYVVALRWMPAVPFFAVNMGLGLTPVGLRQYVLVSWAAMLPFTFLYAHAGCELGRLDSPKGVVHPAVLVALAAVALVPLLLRWVMRKMLKEDAGAAA